MLRVSRRSSLVAGAAVFAGVYAVLGLFPVSAYIGVSSFLTFREVVSPLAGMIFGPLTGGLSMIVGNFVDFAFGKPVVFDFLDFVPDLASALLAGLVFMGRRKAALGLPLALVLWYSVDPLSQDFVSVEGFPVPFFWLHLLSVLCLGIAFVLESQGRLTKLNPAFVGVTVFASTMTGHIAGSIMYENVIGRINGLATTVTQTWPLIFYSYPAERLLFTVLGTLVSVPALRSLSRRSQRVGDSKGPPRQR